MQRVAAVAILAIAVACADPVAHEATAVLADTVNDANPCTIDGGTTRAPTHTWITGCRVATLSGTLARVGSAPSTFRIQAYDIPSGNARETDVTWSSATAFSALVATTSAREHVRLAIEGTATVPAYRDAYADASTPYSVGTVPVVDRASSLTVGPAGATIVDASGMVQLEIPPNAVSTSTAITITAIQATPNLPYIAPNVTAPVVGIELEPHGMTFARPVTVRLRQEPASSSVNTPIWLLDRNALAWTEYGFTSPSGSTITFQTSHFSSWSWPKSSQLPGGVQTCFWCNDNLACTTDTCSPSLSCGHTLKAAGTACSDGNSCNGAETCNASGTCLAGQPPPLTDNNSCTADTCDATGIHHTPVADGTACSNGCGGTCQAGACSIPLDDGNACTVDLCQNGQIVHQPVVSGTSCSDGEVCNGVEVCNGSGACIAGTDLAAGTMCGDTNPCNGTETCDGAGACAGTPALPPGASCSDGEACNGAETCSGAGACLSGVKLADGTACFDGNDCTSGDHCSAGACGGTAQVGQSCTDGNLCTAGDVCNMVGACVGSVQAGAPCSDGDACNGAETCSAAGVCQAGNPPVIGDGNPSTIDSCDPDTGTVKHSGCAAADLTIATTVAMTAACFYTGPAPLQTALDGTPLPANAFDPLAIAVLHGKVSTSNGAPLAGVAITVLDPTAASHDDESIGRTLSRADGQYDLVVRGGRSVAVKLEKTGYLPAQRRIEVLPQSYAVVDDAILIKLDPKVTAVDPATAQDIQIVRGSTSSDASGTRQLTMLFQPGTETHFVFDNGDDDVQSGPIHVRATEYTVGPSGPDAMPASLPPASGYTYAVELSVDEAMFAGAKSVTFTKPVSVYVENFRGFEVGANVPAGYFDRSAGNWVAMDNGRVVEVTQIAMEDGSPAVQLDTVGALGLPPVAVPVAERHELAKIYGVGQKLWRIEVEHFSPHDYNWALRPPDDATFPNAGDPTADRPMDDPCKQAGSIIECENQILGETVAIAGTPFTLNYRSDRVPGRRVKIHVPVTGPAIHDELYYVKVTGTVAGQVFGGFWSAAPDLAKDFYWDGRDSLGHPVQGEQTVLITVSYFYKGHYGYPTGFGGGLDSAIFTTDLWAQLGYVELKHNYRLTAGHWNAVHEKLGGWSFDVHHVYDPVARTLYMGTGERRHGSFVGSMIKTIAGGGPHITWPNPDNASTDGLQATNTYLITPSEVATGPDGRLYFASLYGLRRMDPDGTLHVVAGNKLNGDVLWDGDSTPNAPKSAIGAGVSIADFAFGPDGSIYIADYVNHRIRKVDTQGHIWTVAGTGSLLGGMPFGGDGGPATEVQLNNPNGVAVAPDGTLYISDNGHSRVRKVTPDGIIATVAGNGNGGQCVPCGNNGPGVGAYVSPGDLELAPDGNLYIAQYQGNKVWRLDPSGMIQIVAGQDVASGYDGDLFAANHAKLDNVHNIALGPDGSLYIADMYGGRIRMVLPPLAYPMSQPMQDNGIIVTVAGGGPAACGQFNFCGENGLALEAHIGQPRGLGVGPDGTIYIAEAGDPSQRILAVAPIKGPQDPFGFYLPSEDAKEIYHFDATGRHTSTTDALTQQTIYKFHDDAQHHLISIEDSSGRLTKIIRNAAGDPTQIVAPGGQVTQLGVVNGYLETVTEPNGDHVAMQYLQGLQEGLLHVLTDPRGYDHTFEYDAGTGLLTSDAMPGGGKKSLVRSDHPRGWLVSVKTDEMISPNNDVTTYDYTEQLDGGVKRTVTSPGGLQEVTTVGPKGDRSTVYPDGSTLALTQSPDPRFGLLAPYTSSMTMTTGTHTLTAQTTITADHAPDDLLALQKWTETTSVNGKSSSVIFDATVSPRTVTRISPLARSVTSELDVNGRVAKVKSAGLADLTFEFLDGAAGVNADKPWKATQGSGLRARTTQMTWDPVTGDLRSISGPLGVTTVFERDASGRVWHKTLPGNRSVFFQYDHAGNIIQVQPPGGGAYIQTYTPDGDPKTLLSPDVPGVAEAEDTSWSIGRRVTKTVLPGNKFRQPSYDSYGRLDFTTTNDGTADVTYFPLNDPAHPGLLKSMAAENGIEMTFDWDGRLAKSVDVTGPFPGKVTFGYDNNLRRTSEALDNEPAIITQYDDDDLLEQVGALDLHRDAASGQLIGATLGGVEDTFVPDPDFGELVDHDVAYNGAPRYALDLQSDDLGRVIEKSETTTIGATSTTHVYDYQYTPAGQLWTVERDGQLIATYGYDDAGNRTSTAIGNASVGATFDAQQRITSQGATTYGATLDGNVATRTANSVTRTYEYGARGELVKVSWPANAPTTVVEYKYDPYGRRVGRWVNGTLRGSWIYGDAPTPVAEIRDGVQTRFVYGTSQAPEYLVRGGTTYRVVSDYIGTPRLVIDTTTGKVVQELEVDAWGVVTRDAVYTQNGAMVCGPICGPDDPSYLPFGFGGGLYDRSTSLVQFGARDYDPETGRFLQKDPLRFGSGDTNFYAYAGSDPVNFGDPSGLSPDPMRDFLDLPVIGTIFGAFATGVRNRADGQAMMANDETFAAGQKLAAKGACQIAIGAKIVGEAAQLAVGAAELLGPKASAPFSPCFVAGTPVETDAGPRPIEDIEPGDLVLSRDQATGETALRPVERVKVTADRRVVEVTLVANDGTQDVIGVTPDHPFFSTTRGWTAASKLVPGESVSSASGSEVIVERVGDRTGTTTVYNLTVSEFHTYFAGASQAWVHNDCNANSFDSIRKQFLYVIKDEDGAVLKYGTTLNLFERYDAAQFVYEFGPGATMEFLAEGSAREMRQLENRLIRVYEWINRALPPCNKCYH
jgi:RHS repeat-associated protein